MINEKTKYCPKCEKEVPISNFRKANDRKDGLQSYCNNCRKVYYKENRKEILRKVKKYQEKNKEKINKQAQINALKRRYGISSDDWQRMFIKQKGHCAICGEHQSNLKRALDIDHCHRTGKVRKLLCSRCNRGLGCFDDNCELLLKAIKYLEENNECLAR